MDCKKWSLLRFIQHDCIHEHFYIQMQALTQKYLYLVLRTRAENSLQVFYNDIKFSTLFTIWK